MVEMSLIMVAGAGLALIISGIVGGFMARMFVDGWGYARLENEINALRNKINSGLGVEAKAEKKIIKEERLAMAAADFAALKESGLSMPEIIKELAPKYIDIAPDILKMLGIKGGISGLLSM